MAINWIQTGAALKRRRERAGFTQDALASKIGVRLPTVGRLEIGRIRPSLSLLEKLAGALQCRVRDMLVEEPGTEREPSMLGAPNYFRLGIQDAARAALLPRDINTGETERCDYSSPGFHLAIHFDNYVTDEAREELDVIFAIKNKRTFKRRFWAFLKRDFPGCIALVPMDRREEFLKGFDLAIEDGRFSWSR